MQPVIWVWLVTSFLTANSYIIFSLFYFPLLIGNTKVLMRLIKCDFERCDWPSARKASLAVLNLAGGFSLFELYSRFW